MVLFIGKILGMNPRWFIKCQVEYPFGTEEKLEIGFLYY